MFPIYVTLNGKYSIPDVKDSAVNKRVYTEFISMEREPETQINSNV